MSAQKHLTLTGISEISWKDAINSTIADASKTIDYINSIKILEQTAKVTGKKIVEYYATIDLCFTIEREREG
ncbi:MAG: dodecin family protein [Lachnospiraceae bacterium]|nr:dodecin family protein [Lachnospiraceae bacterium]